MSGDWYGYADGAVELGALKGNRGTQVDDVADDIDLAGVASVVIWCERFSVGFGSANLGWPNVSRRAAGGVASGFVRADPKATDE